MSGLPQEIVRARLQIVLDHTFMASAIARLPIEPMPSAIRALAATDGYHVFVDTERLPQESPSTIRFILLHEVMHVVLGHIDRRGERRPREWALAVDHAVNLLLEGCGFTPPEHAVCDRRFRSMTAEAIYDALLPKGQSAEARAPETHTEGLGHPEAHLDPADPRLAGASAHPMPAPVERRRLRKNLLAPMKCKLAGIGAGASSEEIEAAESEQVPWRELLAQFVTGLRQTDYRLFPFNKKHLWRGLYLPSVGEPGPEHIALAVDTSGSMDERALSLVLGELEQLRHAAPCRITLIQCDYEVQSVDAYGAHDPLPHHNPARSFRFTGRGGTRFEPVFDRIAHPDFQADHGRPDALVFYTDGYGDFPDEAPDYPVLWLITKLKIHPFTRKSLSQPAHHFGQTIPIAV